VRSNRPTAEAVHNISNSTYSRTKAVKFATIKRSLDWKIRNEEKNESECRKE